jgi:hypothetical protein
MSRLVSAIGGKCEPQPGMTSSAIRIAHHRIGLPSTPSPPGNLATRLDENSMTQSGQKEQQEALFRFFTV